MQTVNIFDRLLKHPLRLTVEGSKQPASFVHGWNDAIYISLSIDAPPAPPGSWYPEGYKTGWENCRALLEAVHPRSGHVPVVKNVVENTTAALLRSVG